MPYYNISIPRYVISDSYSFAAYNEVEAMQMIESCQVSPLHQEKTVLTAPFYDVSVKPTIVDVTAQRQLDIERQTAHEEEIARRQYRRLKQRFDKS